MLRAMSLSWSALLVRGLLGIVFGVVTLAWPSSTALALVLLFGIWAFADGVAALVHAWSAERARDKLALAALGVIAIIAGLLAIFSPGITAATLTWILGVWLLVRGILEIVGAIADRADPGASRLVLVLGGLLDGFIGVILIANPGRSALSITVLIGLVALAWGALLVGLAIASRATSKRHPGPVTGAASA